MLKKDADHGLALAVLFRMQDDDGEADAALVSADALSRGRSGDPPTLVRAGKLLAAAGKLSQAADCYEAAQEMKADLDPDYFVQALRPRWQARVVRVDTAKDLAE